MEEKTGYNNDDDAGRPDEFEEYLSSLSVPAGKGKEEAWNDLQLVLAEHKREKTRSGRILPGNLKTGSRVFIRYAAIAASLLVLAFLSVTLARFSGKNTIETTRGEMLSLTLPDQTRVMLNSESSISYSRKGWKINRMVSLLGEAYFDVVSGPGFSVQFQGGSVSVFGTSFNVYARNSEIEVYCRQGSILFESGKISEKLEPGQGLRSGEGERVIRFEQSPEKEIQWIQGEFFYENAPLARVFNEIERQFNITINATGVDLSRRYSGFFRRGNLEQALDMVCIPMNLDYKITGGNIVTVQ
jgi:transmembrane sensor